MSDGQRMNQIQRRIVLIGLVPLFMSLLSVSIINVVLPAIEADLQASSSALQWVLTGYALSFGVVLVAAGRAGDVFGRGQLFMIGVLTAGLDEATRSAIATGSVGSVVLLGNSDVPLRDIRMLTASLTTMGTVDAPMLISVDQEGGTVQRLRGEGFSAMPSAVEQGALADGELRAAARRWGSELAEAGIHYDLAPVGDVVPAAKQDSNAPIGKLKRNYGNDAQSASRSVVEFIDGMHDSGIVTSVKHFPGLGEVVTNTDFGAATDTDTTRDDPNLAPFEAAIAAGVHSVMVSSAVFREIDPDNEAVFSPVVITDLLRGELGYEGVVIADDLGAAKSVRGVAPAERAVRFIEAGGDIVINANPALMGQMIDAVAAKASSDPVFAGRVAESAARVMRLKSAAGLVDCS